MPVDWKQHERRLREHSRSLWIALVAWSIYMRRELPVWSEYAWRELRSRIAPAIAHTIREYAGPNAWRTRWQIASNILFIAGCLLLAYVGYSYFAMWHEQRTLSREWNAHRRVAMKEGRRVIEDDGLVRVVIPKADVDAIVVDGVTHRALSVGPGHMLKTPMPGELGNSVISAHRDTFFRHIIDLRKGDDIVVHRNGEIFHFAVTGRKIVSPDDIKVTFPTQDAELTLITCYPTYFIGPAPKRLVVSSKLAREEPDYVTPDQSSSSSGGDHGNPSVH